MPVHDWTRALPGRFHHFHTTWLVHLADALNSGRLPPGYFALAEQKATSLTPNVVAMSSADYDFGSNGGGGGTAVAVAEPRTDRRVLMQTEPLPARRLAIRHASRDRLVAIIEVVSPRNK
ncbi:MAG: hypothetical protein ACRC7O_08210, partial [Fimbriiglobus sp.]